MHPGTQTIAQDSNQFIAKLKIILQLGLTVIIENVVDSISRTLYPIISMGKLKKIAGKDNEVLLDGRRVPVHYDFSMIITTMSSSPNFGSEISENLIMVNFELSEEAFDA
jgi:hypothetical protein